MSRTDEMFNVLGYKKKKTKESVIFSLRKEREIIFWILDKKIQINFNCNSQTLSLEELQAINECVKELNLI